MIRVVPAILLLCLVGCASDAKAPLLIHRAQLQFNTDETIRVVGVARYSKVTGPSVVGDDFEVRVFPTTAWGPDIAGTKVEVTGKLNDSTRATPPDPSVVPGEYWLGDAKWVPADEDKKK